MKVTYQIRAGLAVAALLMAVGIAASFRAFSQMKAAGAERKHVYEVIQQAADLLSALKDAETGQRGYLVTGNETFLEPYLAVSNSIGDQLETLRRLTTISAAREHLNALTPLITAKMAELAQVIELRRNHDTAAVLVAVGGGEGKRLMDLIRAEMHAFLRIEEDALNRHDADLQSSLSRMFMLIVVASLLTLLLALAFGYLIYRESRQQLKNLLHRETERLLALQTETSQKLQQATDTLVVSEEKLAVTLNSIGDAVIATDAQERVTLLNPMAENLTGWTRAEATGRQVNEIFRIINQETRQPATVPITETLAHGTIHGLANHTVLIARHGGERAIADSCAPIRDRNNQVVGAVLVFRDVTQEYAAQQAVRDGEEKYRQLFESSRDALMMLTPPAWNVVEANDEALRLFGVTSKEDFTRLGLWHHPPERQPDGSSAAEPVSPMIAAALRDGTHFYECDYRRLNGESFAADVLLSRMETKGLVWVQATVRDISTRKQAEEALLKVGPLQSAIFNSANFSSIATDAKGVIQIFNVGAERMLGYTAAEVMNQITPADISDPQEVIARAKALSAELSTPITPGFEALVFKASRGIEDIYELTYIRKDGSRFPAVVSVTALRDAQGGIIGYLLIGTDNTARKQAEEALLKAGALQSAIFNSANFSSIATDARGVIQIFNVGAERMLGYAAAEVMNQITPADISDPQEVIARAKALSAELSTPITPGFEALVFKASRGIEDIYELTYIRKDGSRFPAVVSVTALRDADSNIIGYLLIGTDNTARKQIEEEQKKLDQRLRDQQFYTRSLIESNIDAIMTTDPAGVITDVNKQMETLTDCTRDELIGAPFKNYFTEPERAEASIKQVLSEKKVTNYELTVRARDGKETVVSYNAATFYDRDRKLQGVFAAARDITERKVLDQVLQETNVELERARIVAEKANLAKSDFLSSMSHELRSPLNAILGFAQLMESASPLPPPAQAARIAQILQAGWHLLKLINEILDLAVIESGKVSLSLEPVSLVEVMAECQAMMEPEAQQRGISMTFPDFTAPVFVLADRTRLKQIVINLLSNAIKYNKEAGTVIVNCNVIAPAAAPGGPAGPAHVRISVQDTGAGLTPQKLAQLFQPFNRLGQEANGVAGTGIGLVVTKQLAELMKGVLGVESTVGMGSVFWCELNLVESPRVLARSGDIEITRRLTAPSDAPLRTVLYVEDNPANMELVGQLIARRADLKLITAVNGTLGIGLARSARPAVILMDINLHGISGIDALKILREDPTTANIPVVALSANAMPRDIELGLEAGFFCYLTKPIKVREFMDTLDGALEFAGEPTVAASTV